MFKRSLREELSLFFAIPVLVLLSIIGFVLLPIVGPFCLWKRGPKINKGGHYDHKEG